MEEVILTTLTSVRLDNCTLDWTTKYQHGEYSNGVPGKSAESDARADTGLTFRNQLPLKSINLAGVAASEVDLGNQQHRDAFLRGSRLDPRWDTASPWVLSLPRNRLVRNAQADGGRTEDAQPEIPDLTLFAISDRAIAMRLEKAFKHAVLLCGGKAEPF